MERRMRNTLYIASALFIALMTVASCGSSEDTEALRLLDEAKEYLEQGRYPMALQSIDSLRRMYPKAIEARKEALGLQQEIELKSAQEELEKVDKLLERAKAEFDSLANVVEAHKKALIATPEELTDLTLKRIERDSMQTKFEVLCAKIHWIHTKQKNDKKNSIRQ